MNLILIPQSVLHDCCAVFRRALPKSTMARAAACVHLIGGRDGVRLRLTQPDVAVEYHHATVSESFSVAVPFTALAECVGRGNGTVKFSLQSNDKVEVTWEQVGVPQRREISIRNPLSFPVTAGSEIANDASLLDAISQAMQIPGGGAGQLSLSHIQLRGNGDIVATDGRQLLILGGFQFPWKDAVYVGRTPVFAAREMTRGKVVCVSQSKSHVHFRFGEWMVVLPIASGVRSPNIDSVIPKVNQATTHWHIDEDEAVALAAKLDELPGANEESAPVTVDLGRLPAIRARSENESRCTEVALPHSRVDGKSIRMVLNREFLRRALDLGFRSFRVSAPDKPILCENGKRIYVCITLDPSTALAPQRSAARVMLPVGSSRVNSASTPITGAVPGVPRQISPTSRIQCGAFRGLIHIVQGLWDLVRKQHRKERVK